MIDCRVRSYYRQPVYIQFMSQLSFGALATYNPKSYKKSLIPRPSDWREEGGGQKAWYPLHVYALHFLYDLLYTNPYHVLTNEMVNISKEYRMTS